MSLLTLWLLVLLAMRTADATSSPTRSPTRIPTRIPTTRPTDIPTTAPSLMPTLLPTPTAALYLYAHWIGDNITITSEVATSIDPYEINIDITSNGKIYEYDGGHVRLLFNLTKYDLDTDSNQYLLHEYTGVTECISVSSPYMSVNNIIQNTIVYPNSSFWNNTNTAVPATLGELFTIRTHRYYNDSNTLDTRTTYAITLSNPGIYTFSADVTYDGCAKPRTIADYTDLSRWQENYVPSTNLQSAYFPSNTGVVKINQNLDLALFQSHGGLFLLDSSGCPDGWSSAPGTSSTKCYKLYENPAKFYDAERTCMTSGHGSIDAHLIHISDYDELDVAKGLCRTYDVNSPVKSSGCWIGLADPTGTGNFNWIEPRAVAYPAFRDYRRPGLTNQTFSEGLATSGELCVHIVPWQEDPLILEQGSWNDIACDLEKPFICQAFASTTKYTMTLSAGALFYNTSTIQGGIVNIYAYSEIACLTATKGTIINMFDDCDAYKLYMIDGSSLYVYHAMSIPSDAFIGEPTGTSEGLTPYVYVDASTTVTMNCDTTLCDAIFNAQVNIQGNLVLSNTQAHFNQGGNVDNAFINLLTVNSTLIFGGYAMKMASYDSFDISLSHRGPVIGEYNSFYNESYNITNGVYRIQVTNVETSATQITSCIDYHATADEMKAKLDALTMISTRGNVTVRRYGENNQYGYIHRVELDSISTTDYSSGSYTMSIYCYGISGCGCSETKVSLVDSTNRNMCPVSGKISKVDPSACITPPTISITQLTQLSYSDTSGIGSIIVDGGYHRLAPIAAVEIRVINGKGIVAADEASWYKLSTDGYGTLLLAGSGWLAWDSAELLFRPSWEQRRGLISSLEKAPEFTMTSTYFSIGGHSSVYTTCINSTMTWGTGEWSGGNIGGRSSVHITTYLDAYGGHKTLRDAITFYLDAGAEFVWSDGNITMSNGADVVVNGVIRVSNSSNASIFWGQAQLFGEKISTEQIEPGRQWHGYYDNIIPQELKTGWYQNPLCGSQCLGLNNMYVLGSGSIYVYPNASAVFFVPVNLEDVSTVTISEVAHLVLGSGGVCGNSVVMDMKSGSILEFSGGRVFMRATCTVKGEGELLVTSGEHDLAFSIDAHITISGGAMVWPLSRGSGYTITFNGGLLLNNYGKLQVQAFSTTIIVKKEVWLKDNCNVQFPVTGSAAIPSNFDAPDAPDLSPRGNFTATEIMKYEGGTLQGKADFTSKNILYLYGGTKYIKQLAKLVNQGHCEWTTGDLQMSDGADFNNVGSLQMGDGYLKFNGSNLILGTVIPIENGGDVYAKNFHSFDIDGYLDFSEYVALRTQFVSRAPEGWDQTDQLPDRDLR